ncbi:hypothetical protein TNCV_3007791 [Trichonephila clavipes]|nr:hypothetical protein TNCV_3007791 [Trichonephila clavipes]
MKPQGHSYMRTYLSPQVVEKIMPVYQRLASDTILERCVAGKTQNSNESLHSYTKMPKKRNPSFHPPSDSDSSLDTVATPERIAFNFNSRLKGSLSPTDRFWQPTKINDVRLNMEDGRHFNTHTLDAIDSCEEFAVYFLLVKSLGPEHAVERYFASDIDLWYLDRIYWGLHLNIVGC